MADDGNQFPRLHLQSEGKKPPPVEYLGKVANFELH